MFVVRDIADPSERIIQIDRDAVNAVVLRPDGTPAATAPTTPVASPAATP